MVLLTKTRDGKLAAGSIATYSGLGGRLSGWSPVCIATRRYPSPTRSSTPAAAPDSRRNADFAMASNTGCTSAGELLMTFRISAVAVCRSSASLVSLNRRTFSIAITAWSAKVLSRSTWWSLNAPGSRRVTLIVPMAAPSRSIGTNSTLRNPRRAGHLAPPARPCPAIGLRVADAERRLGPGHPRNLISIGQRRGEQAFQRR